MPRRRCLDCHALTTTTRCPTCRAQRRKVYDNPEWRRLRREQVAAVPYCEQCGAVTDLTVDHVMPRSLAAGVRTLCRSCNSRKGARTT